MILIAFSFVIEALWLILSPFTEIVTITTSLVIALIMMLLASYFFIKNSYTFSTVNTFFSFIAIGVMGSFFLYFPALKEQQLIAHALPETFFTTFKVIQNHQAHSTTIQIIEIHDLDNHTQISSEKFPIENSEKIKENEESPKRLLQAFKNSQVRIFNLKSEIKALMAEGEIYQGTLSIRPRYFRNIPGDRQRILQSIAKKEIGYGKLEDIPIKISGKSIIQSFRQKSAHYFSNNFKFGAYLSALSVGITNNLSQADWLILRQTGTIHLVSISGLHLSLTAFYAFIIFRCIGGLFAFRKIAPFKFAAICAIIIAWNYALIAGMSLPTVRAAIMFTLVMISLLINRALFSLHSISMALLIILILNPLSILQPGFWLSFMAVATLILSSRVFTSALKALLFTQLIISLLLIPLTASFFGEVSLISPLINLFAIPWTTTMVMPFLLLGTLFLPISQMIANVFLHIADQSIYVLVTAIQWSAQAPFASIQTERMPFIGAIFITITSLVILYYYPRFRLLKSQYFPLFLLHSKRYITQLYLQFYNHFTGRLHSLVSNSIKHSIIAFIIIVLTGTLITMNPVASINQRTKYSENFDPHDPNSFATLPNNRKNNKKPNEKNIQEENIHIYLLPVGEGLSLLFHSSNLTFLFDTGNRFMNFDAGKQIILPTLHSLNIKALDLLFLSLKNQQHIGGTRSIRTQLSEDNIHKIIAHRDLLWLLDSATDCQQFQYHSEKSNITIESIPEIQSSCAFVITIANQVRLYLFSDITQIEWKLFLDQQNKSKTDEACETDFSHEILLYPNQARSDYPLSSSYFSDNSIMNTLLFSTREVHTNILRAFKLDNITKADHPQNSDNPHDSSQIIRKNIPNIKAYNSYYGTIHLHLKISTHNKNAKPKTKLRIEDYADNERYWWLKL